jgi:hypothetical protein
VDLANEGVDLDIRVGDDIAPNLIARQLATNHRISAPRRRFSPAIRRRNSSAIWPPALSGD